MQEPLKLLRSVRAFGLVLVATLAIGCGGETTVRERSAAPPRNGEGTPRPRSAATTLAGIPLVLEIAAEPAARGKGLSGRTALNGDEGMIFLYGVAESRSFWMMDCLIGLDIAFLDDERRILNVVSLDPPRPGAPESEVGRAQSAGAARYVLEMRKGWFAEKKVGPGAAVVFSDAVEAAARGAAR